MSGEILFERFDRGKIMADSVEKKAMDIQWNAHPNFKGVYIKHLLCAADTNSRLSYHLVRIDPGCEIGEHIHEGKWETHEVIAGAGQCAIGNKNIAYEPGVLAAVPDSIKHKVVADKEGLLLFAKFIPALL